VVCGFAIAAMQLTCTSHDDAPPPVASTAALITQSQVDAIRLARWQVWDHLAAGLPDGHVLSFELLHSRPGQSFAVATIVKNGHAVQSIVGAVPAAALAAGATDPAAPDAIPLGRPPDKEPPTPGIVAQGTSLLATAFGADAPALPNAVAIGSPPPHQPTEPGVVARGSSIRPSGQDVARLRLARWQAWNQLASGLPDGYVLSVELLHSRIDRAFAVFTAVRGHRAVQSIVGNPPTAAALATEDPASPDGVPLGYPPDKEPPDPGIVAQGSSLLAAAFGPAGATSAPRTTSTAASVPAGLADEVARVRVARWQAWDRLAAGLPEGHVLSIELLHSQPGQSFAVVTVVKSGHAVQSIVGAAPRTALAAGASNPAAPDVIALGQPPEKEPPPPGILAQGTSLLAAAFSDAASDTAGAAAPNTIALGDPPPKQPPEPGAVAQPSSIAAASAQDVADVRLARWQVWNQLAAGLPDGYLLSIELLHSRADHAFAVFTVVRGHQAIQSIVGTAPATAALASDGPASPDGMPLGSPPDKEPPDPGIVAQGGALLTAAFGTSTPSQ
jgi:hypothetical protein